MEEGAHPRITAFAPCLLDHPAEAGERSERKPGVVTPRDGVHEVETLSACAPGGAVGRDRATGRRRSFHCAREIGGDELLDRGADGAGGVVAGLGQAEDQGAFD